MFHIRIRTDACQIFPLTTPARATDLLNSVRLYHATGRWWCELFLLMPDHLHALLAFPREPGMAATIREWKRGAARLQGVKWQENFFDHRIRSDKFSAETWHYIRRNPVAKGLCPDEDSWTYWWSGTLAAG
jgi:REP element-mobilizing transposase RayT